MQFCVFIYKEMVKFMFFNKHKKLQHNAICVY